MSFFKKKSFESVYNSYSTSGLDKNLTAFDLVLIGLGGLIGTGVFALTGFVAAQYSGPAVILSYAIAGFVSIFMALAYTELATMLPTSGSVYTYTYVAFGKGFAWIVGGVIILEMGFATAAVAGSWSAYVQGILISAGYGLPEYLVKTPSEGGVINLPALLIVIIVSAMLYRGTKESKKLNTILVFVKLIAIFIFIFFAAPHFDATNWDNFMPYGFDDVLHGASILFFAFTGCGTLASAAEECKNPKKDLIIGIIGSLLFVTVVYMAVAAVLTGAVPFGELNTAQSLVYVLQLKGHKVGAAIVATGVIAGMTSVIMINSYGQSRIFYVIARDGLLPKFLAKLHHKYDSPYGTLLVFTVVVGAISSLLPYGISAQLSSMGALTDYIIISIIVMLFRMKHPNVERPFTCPAIFVVAPIAVFASLYLLFKQIIDKNGALLTMGEVYIYWFIAVFILFTIKELLFKSKNQ